MRPTFSLLLLVVALPAVAAQTPETTTDGVIRFLEARLARDPDDFIAAGKLGENYLQKAREGGPLESHAKAEAMFRRVLQWTPDSYPAGVSLGSALVSQHKFRDAAALAGKLIAAQPGEAPAYGLLGDARLELGDLPGAAEAYTKLAGFGPGLSVSSRRARLDWMKGNIPAALSNFTEAARFSNSPPEALAWARVQKGGLLFRTGRFTEAESEYRAALEIFPDYFLARDHLAELRAAQGKFDEAATAFEQLAARTQRPEYLQAMGDVLTAARKSEAAKPYHERALAAYLRETGAGNVHYFHHLAGFYADVREDGAEAEKWARRDLEVRQGGSAWDALAWALFWTGDYAAAVTAMQKALAAGTKDPHVLAHAGGIFVRAGKISEGREFMKQAEKINPRHGEFHLHR